MDLYEAGDDRATPLPGDFFDRGRGFGSATCRTAATASSPGDWRIHWRTIRAIVAFVAS